MELVERERELHALTTVLDGLGEGRAATVLIEGPAGIGKTRLLSELKRDAAGRGIPVLAARGSELEREFPFGVVRQLFEPALNEPPNELELFEGAAEIAGQVFESPAGGTAGGDSSFAVLHGLYWLTLDISNEQPLILAIDDIQWCDRPSLRLLAYLVRRLEGLPLLIVATLRSTEPGTDTALLGEIANDPLTERLLPGPLSREAIPALVGERLAGDPDDAFVDACHEATGGNPLLLGELLKGLAAERVEPRAEQAGVVRDLGPRAVSRAVLLRLARLGDADVAVARAIAVLGEGAELSEIAALSGTGEREVATATGELARVEILRPERPLGFVHPLVRDAIFNDLPPGTRELEHTRAARMLHEAGAPAERVAAHLIGLPPLGEEWVAETLVAAARSAAEKGGTENAIGYLTRALAEPLAEERRAHVLFELGIREMDINGTAAAGHLELAYEALTATNDRAWAAYGLARTLMFTGLEEEAAIVARRAQAELPAEMRDHAQALEAIELQTVFFGRPAVGELERTIPYREGVEGDGAGAKMLTALTAYAWANADGPADRCGALAQEALGDGTLLEVDNGLFWVTALVTLIYAEPEETPMIWDDARAQAHARGSLFTVLTVDLWRGYDLMLRGDLAQAEESMESALEDMILWSGSEARMVSEWPTAFLARVQVERGALETAGQTLDMCEGVEEKGSDGASFWRQSRIEWLLASGRPEEALAMCDAYEARLGHLRNPAAAPWRSLRAEVLDRLERTDEGIALCLEELEAAKRWGAAQPIGRALRVLGTLEREKGIEHLREAVATLEGSAARLEHAKALLALGTALRLARKPSEAREPLRRALEIGSACSADVLVGRARDELGASGARPRREALSGVESLTPSEKRVAEMAAEEMTNREIAQELFVTPKTVEVHLSNAYRKLDIRSRRQLAAALAPAPQSTP